MGVVQIWKTRDRFEEVGNFCSTCWVEAGWNERKKMLQLGASAGGEGGTHHLLLEFNLRLGRRFASLLLCLLADLRLKQVFVSSV